MNASLWRQNPQPRAQGRATGSLRCELNSDRSSKREYGGGSAARVRSSLSHPSKPSAFILFLARSVAPANRPSFWRHPSASAGGWFRRGRAARLMFHSSQIQWTAKTIFLAKVTRTYEPK